MIEPGAEKLDELADHAARAQHLGDGQHQIGRRRAFLERAGQPEADHFGNEHGDRLAQHRRLGLDAADAPAEHGEAVDHRRVAVGADAGVRIGDRLAVLLAGPHGLGEIFDVDLVADAGARRHDAEIVEGRGAPAQEFVALPVALELALDILPEGVGRAEMVDRHRMVDHQVDRDQRVDPLRIAAERADGVAHRRQVDDRRHAGESPASARGPAGRRFRGSICAGRARRRRPGCRRR